MGRTRTDEFRKDAVRIALTSGLTRKQVADDLGVGMSTLNVQNRSSRPQRSLSSAMVHILSCSLFHA